jgi:dehydrogenase/reductase SDR family member 12
MNARYRFSYTYVRVAENRMTMELATTIDTLLDRTIVLGYGNVGLEIRRRLADWPADPPRIEGKVVLVTGAGSGIGLAACIGFARLGASVRAMGRDQRRALDAAALVAEAVPGADVRPVACDVSNLRELRTFAERFNREERLLHVLVNNAGVMPGQREHSADGNELMFATHVLAPFALTAMLGGLLARSAPARVINVSSAGMYGQRLHPDDLQSEHSSYGPRKLYARTKREQVVIAELWAKRLEGTGVTVHSMHPGWVDTPGLRRSLPVFHALARPILRSLEQGADTIAWLGAAPEPLLSSGRFWHDRRPRPTHYLIGAAQDSPDDRRKLWELCQSQLDRHNAPDDPPSAA